MDGSASTLAPLFATAAMTGKPCDRSWNGDRRDVRFRFMRTPLGRTMVQVIGGGAIVFAVGLLQGRFGAGN